MSTDPKQITVGDRKIDVQRFSTFKVIESTSIITSIMEEVPQLGEKISTFTQDFRAKNALKISRAAAELRYPAEELAKVSEAAWEAAGNEIEVPASPTTLDLAAHVFPDVFRVAEKQVLRLLALIAAPNSELREADEEGDVEAYLERKAKGLRHEDAGELLDLLIATADVLREQFGDKGDSFGPLGRILGVGRAGDTPSPEAPTPVEVAPAESGIEGSSKPDTSTPSESPSDGPEESPSTGSPTSTLAGSAG